MKRRVLQLFKQIKDAEIELKEIRDKCKHKRTHQGDWSDGPGRITHANICSDCGSFISATGKLPDILQIPYKGIIADDDNWFGTSVEDLK